MKKINYLPLFLFCLILTCCHTTNQQDLDDIACRYIEALVRFDKSTLLELSDEATHPNVEKYFKDFSSQEELERAQIAINMCKILTEVTKRDINEKENYATITVKVEAKLEHINSKPIAADEFPVLLRKIDGRWLVVGP